MKRVTFDLSDCSTGSVVPLSAELSRPQSSSSSVPVSSSLPFGQSLSLLLPDPPLPLKASNAVVVSSCPSSSFRVFSHFLNQK